MITIEGGGCCAVIESTVDAYGAIATVTVVSGGRGYNRGSGAQATATLSGQAGDLKRGVSQVIVEPNQVARGTLVPPDVTFACNAADLTDVSCFGTGDVSMGGAPAWNPGRHAAASRFLDTIPRASGRTRRATDRARWFAWTCCSAVSTTSPHRW